MKRSDAAERAAQREAVRALLHMKQADIAAITGLTLRMVNIFVCSIKRETSSVNHLQKAKLIRERVRQYLLTRPSDTRQSAVGTALGISTDQARRAMLAVQQEAAAELMRLKSQQSRPEGKMFWVEGDRLFSENRRPREVTL